MNQPDKPVPIRADWWRKTLAGAVLGWTLAFALAGIFAWVGPGGIAAPQKSQFVMWMIVPLWLPVFGFVYLFSSGRSALLWLGGANLLAYAMLMAVRGGGAA